MNPILTAVCLASVLFAGCKPKHASRTEKSSQELTLLVGTYTSGESKGIYSFRFDEETGAHVPLGEAVVGNPSYLTPSADGRFVYAVSEFNDERAAVYAFAFDKENGVFRLLNAQKTGGEDPCYLTTDGKYVITANYSGGSISVFPIAGDGSLFPACQLLQFEGSGADPERQEKPHLHCVRITPDSNYLYANDLGTDRLYKYVIDPKANAREKTPLLKAGTPAVYRMQAGSGPRHLVFSPNGKYAYSINEIGGTVDAFRYAGGNLEAIQTIVADTVQVRGSGDIRISPDGRYLYASNRLQADGIAIFRIHPEDGTLTRTGYQFTGVHPRNLAITPNGKYLLAACRDSRVVQVYERNPETGALSYLDKDIPVDRPVCVKFVP